MTGVPVRAAAGRAASAAPAAGPAACRPPNGAVEVPWDLAVPAVDIHLVGYGTRLPNDFTLEMLAVLRRCRRVFGAPPVHVPGAGLPPMDSVMGLFRRGRDRVETHRMIADLLLDAAADGGPVAFATYGSAVVGMPASHDILRRAACRGLTVHVTTAVSSLDAVCADLAVDPLRGLAVWEAATLVALGIEPDTRATLLVPQVPLLRATGAGDPVTALRDHLLRFYPPEHTVHFVTAAGPWQPDGHRESVRLGDLDHPGRHRLNTLLVPPVPQHRSDAATAERGRRP